MQGFYDTLAMISITTVDHIKVCIAYFHAAEAVRSKVTRCKSRNIPNKGVRETCHPCRGAMNSQPPCMELWLPWSPRGRLHQKERFIFLFSEGKTTNLAPQIHHWPGMGKVPSVR
ncbi:hypothetical protein E2C01_015770 [Portunus trituberculatus]|uniref:Uncharacterized protein n=1 Tax=Portunus trituberculatus TaxID=210409 RepID=A0A5B7DNQ1_PORTR|nr:hypothetical protein [Portunus trituberculatus]